MSRFLERAEQVLEVALTTGEGAAECLILFDDAGGMRMLDPAGWSLTGLIQEYGARELYRIERRNGTVRVAGWSASQQCLLQRKPKGYNPPKRYPSMLQAVPRLAA